MTLDLDGWCSFTQKVWGPKWFICRDTEANRQRYGTCITKREYHATMDVWHRIKQQETKAAAIDIVSAND